MTLRVAALVTVGLAVLAGAPVYVPLVLVPLTITWALARRAARRAG